MVNSTDMLTAVTLVCEPKNYVGRTFLFFKVAGIPLLLRNILSLHKAKTQKIGLMLPATLTQKYLDEIEPELNKRGIHIDLRTEDGEKGGHHAPSGPVITGITTPAHALVEPKLPPPYFRLVIDELPKIKQAEKILLETIRLSTPGPIARYLNKRLSLCLSLRLARWGFHPNGITLVNMVLGISSGVFVAQGTYLSYFIGGLIFQMASIFDGCDGEVAKLSFKTSKFGQYFDTLSDNGALVSFFVGLIAAFSKQHSSEMTLGISALLLVGLGGLLWQMISFLKKNTQSASLTAFDKEYLSKLSPNSFSPCLLQFIRFGKTLLRKDCFSLLIFLFAVIGILPWWLYLAIGATWIANSVLLFLKLQPTGFFAPAQDDHE